MAAIVLHRINCEYEGEAKAICDTLLAANEKITEKRA
jgi:hypothetical protein